MRRILVFLLTVFMSAALYSCGGGGGSSSTASSGGTGVFSSKPVAVSDVSYRTSSRSSLIPVDTPPDNITITFDVYAQSESYNVDLYLTRHEYVGDNASDYNFYSTTVNGGTDGTVSITLCKGDPAFERILNYYGGKYYIKVRVTTPDGYEAWAVSSQPITLKKIWTFAVYMDADNSLNDYADYNLGSMESVGSDRNVNVVVQLDKEDSTAKRYLVEAGNLVKIQELGELDMASIETLENFGEWIKENYPADHYFIVLYDHGLGFERSLRALKSRDILEDDTTTWGGIDLMTIPDLSTALDNISQTMGQKIDIVGFDACLMNMVEIAYQLRNSTKVMVGSEDTIPVEGWPYSTMIGDIEGAVASNNNVSPDTIASIVTEDYYDHYFSIGVGMAFSSVDLSGIDNLVTSINGLAEALLNNMNNTTIVDDIKNNIYNKVFRFLVSYEYRDYSYADLGSLASLIYQDDNMTASIRSSAESVLNNLKSVVILSTSYGYTNDPTAITGLTIWLPDNATFTYANQHYQELDFAKDTKWDDFLTKILEQ